MSTSKFTSVTRYQIENYIYEEQLSPGVYVKACDYDELSHAFDRLEETVSPMLEALERAVLYHDDACGGFDNSDESDCECGVRGSCERIADAIAKAKARGQQ